MERKMGRAATPTKSLVDDLVAKHPRAPARTLARRLVAETGGALTLEQARTKIRYALGTSGRRDRRHATSPRPPRQAGEVLVMPASQATPWEVHTLQTVGKIGVISDIHVPYHSEVALAAAVGHLQREGIDHLLLNGDWADFYSISSWIKNPKLRNFSAELQQTRQLLRWLRQEFPGIPITAKTGNHEDRWETWLFQHAPEISDEPEMSLERWFRLDDLKIDLVKDKRIIMAGELPILHGHELPKGISSPVNPARGAWMRTKHTAVVGHQHQTSGHCEPDLFHAETFCWSSGCLCDLTPDYARVNRWNWGFIVVNVEAGGEFDVSNYRITKDGKVRSS